MKVSPYFQEGTQVRRFFEEDLKKLESGYCLIPEWICNSMPEVALKSHHEVHFYPVNFPKDAEIPLETNWQHLTCLIEHLSISKKNIIVLTAFPLGYVDSKMSTLFDLSKRMPNIHIFLDLAQSYGSFNFLPLLPLVRAIYISFNGRKLIDSGGALRICHSSGAFENQDMHIFQKRVENALQKQRNSWKAALEDVRHFFQDQEALNLALHRYNHPSKRSSYHRTALFMSSKSAVSQNLVQEGCGQMIHPHPQNGKVLMSPAYEAWKDQTILLFSSKREQ